MTHAKRNDLQPLEQSHLHTRSLEMRADRSNLIPEARSTCNGPLTGSYRPPTSIHLAVSTRPEVDGTRIENLTEIRHRSAASFNPFYRSWLRHEAIKRYRLVDS